MLNTFNRFMVKNSVGIFFGGPNSDLIILKAYENMMDGSDACNIIVMFKCMVKVLLTGKNSLLPLIRDAKVSFY